MFEPPKYVSSCLVIDLPGAWAAVWQLLAWAAAGYGWMSAPQSVPNVHACCALVPLLELFHLDTYHQGTSHKQLHVQELAGEAAASDPGGVLGPLKSLARMFTEATKPPINTVILAGDHRQGKSFLASKLIVHALSVSGPIPELDSGEEEPTEAGVWLAPPGNLGGDAGEQPSVTIGLPDGQSTRKVAIFGIAPTAEPGTAVLSSPS
jgi:hypothetical protein